MKILVLITAILFSPLVCASDFDGTIEQNILDSTLKIIVITFEKVFTGSGTIINVQSVKGKNEISGTELTILTCSHVLKSESLNPILDIVFIKYIRDNRGEVIKRIVFSMKDPDTFGFFVVQYDTEDVAIIKIKIQNSESISYKSAIMMTPEEIKEKISVLSEVLFAGSPFGLESIVIHGKIIQLNVQRANNTDIFADFHLVDHNFAHGNSGGGVYSKDGKLIGIVQLTLRNQLGGFIGLDNVYDLIKPIVDLKN